MKLDTWRSVVPTTNHQDRNDPCLEPILLAAATLWCRTIKWPTDQDIAEEACLPVSAVANIRHETGNIRQTLAHAVVEALMQAYRLRRQSGVMSTDALHASVHMCTSDLATMDGDLMYLPLLACVAAQAREDHTLACVQAITRHPPPGT
jgi:hypothetical protein